MRIGFDAHAIGSRLGGNETYARELLKALLELCSGDEIVAYFADATTAEPWQARHTNLEARVLRSSGSIPRLVAELPLRARLDGIDLLHVQYVAPPLCPVPVVATVHDLSFDTFPQWFKPGRARSQSLGVRHTVRRARRVLAISENMGNEIVSKHHLDPTAVSVTPLAVDFDFFSADTEPASTERCLRDLGIDRPYVLSVGNVQPRKNLVRLVEAFALVRAQLPGADHQLVLAGAERYRSSDVMACANRRGLEHKVIMAGYVSQHTLRTLYSGAEVFAFPSLYEGFGLPVLEAMACGTPVVTSNATALPEVVGDAAVLVSPMEPASIAEGILRLIDDPDLRRHNADRGLRRAGRFTWKATATATLEAYRLGLNAP